MTSELPEVLVHVYPTDGGMLGKVNHAATLGFLERARWKLLAQQAAHVPGEWRAMFPRWPDGGAAA